MAEWWRDAVVYQIYIRSFADANGDGEGDIAGIRSRLPYLRDLGVDAIWITPWYPSPMADGGYDVADYRAIDPRYGSLDDARALIADAHAAGIRVMIDVVPNHTSSEHPWFREALSSPRGSAARARYHFRDGRGPRGEEPPNNWRSAFGGIAWTPAPDDGIEPRQWYLHLFDGSQPDLNWDDPEIRADFERTLEFWLGLGVDGFRIDVAWFLLKAEGLPDIPENAVAIAPVHGQPEWDPAAHPYEDRPGVHEIYRRWRRIVDERAPDRQVVFCGEIQLPVARTARYLRTGELHTAFNFDFALQRWDAAELRASIDRTLHALEGVGAPATWILGNHDLPRVTYRLGKPSATGDDGGRTGWNAWSRTEASDRALGLRRARAAALLYLALPGIAYLYQGDELGLPEVLELRPDARQDPTFRRSGGTDVGRDGTRVPIPWSGDRPPFGFGPEGSRPWLPQPAEWRELSVEVEGVDPSSTLLLYRTALWIRRNHPGFEAPATSPSTAGFRWIESPEGTLVFVRAGSTARSIACAVNLSQVDLPLPPGARVLLASSGLGDGEGVDTLPADTAVWFESDELEGFPWRS